MYEMYLKSKRDELVVINAGYNKLVTLAKNLTDPDSIINFQKTYDEIYNSLNSLFNEINNYIFERATDESSEYDDESIKDEESPETTDNQYKELQEFIEKDLYEVWDNLDSLFDDSKNRINQIILNESVNIRKSVTGLDSNVQIMQHDLRTNQGMQLTVFSFVMTILTFILNNARILSIDDIDIRSVLLVNIGFLIAAVVLFTLLYVLILPMFGREVDKEQTSKALWTFAGSFGFLLVSLICVSIFVSSPDRKPLVLIETKMLENGIEGEVYTASLKCTKDAEDMVKWEIVGGYLPDGLNLNPNSNTISGIPKETGIFSLYISVSLNGEMDTKQFSIYIEPRSTVTSVPTSTPASSPTST